MFKVTRCLKSSAKKLFEIHEYDKDLPQKLRETFLQLDRVSDNVLRGKYLLRGRESLPYIYGGHVVAQSLKAACEAIPTDKEPHSFHSYFIKAGSVEKPVDYEVTVVRDGKSFSTRRVHAIQDNELLFSMDVSFHIGEKDSIIHVPTVNIPKENPEDLKSARQLMFEALDQDRKLHKAAKLFIGYKLAQFPPTFHGFFEMRPINQRIYEMHPEKPLQEADFTLWVKPQVPIGDDPALQRYFAAYLSDSSLVETALMPHLSKGYIPGQIFSLDHCLWFHQTKFSMDDWMLWEQKSDFAGNARTITRGRLFTKDGELILTALQEGLARASNDPVY